MRDCVGAASIVFNGVLLCAQHANQALEERLASLKSGERHANGDQPLEHG
jgi:hypothetical protein